MLDRKGRKPKPAVMFAGHRSTIFALLLTAAAPVASEVQHVPPEQAVPILGHAVADTEGKEIGHLVDHPINTQIQRPPSGLNQTQRTIWVARLQRDIGVTKIEQCLLAPVAMSPSRRTRSARET